MARKTPLFFPFALLAIPALLLCLGVFYYLDKNESEQAFAQMIEKRSKNLQMKNDFAIQYFNPLIADINFLSETLMHLQRTEQTMDTGRLSETLQTYMMLNPDYDQIRILDTSGQEVIKWINDTNIYKVPDSSLQYKGNRDYFKFGQQVENGEVYISKLELNMEGDTIELPYRPVIRLVAPLLLENGQRIGYIVSNYDLQLYLDKVKQYYLIPEGEFSFLNKEGYWLTGPEDKLQWAFMFNDSTKSFSYQYPAIWETMLQEKSGYVQTNSGYFVYEEINPSESLPTLAKQTGIELKLISKRKGFTIYFLSNDYVSNIIYTWRKQALPILGTTSIFIILLSLAWAVYKKRELDKNQKLQEINVKLTASEATLKERNEELEHFGHIASHDLQEPLRTIKSYLSIISKRYADQLDSTGQKSMTFVVQAAIRMEKLIQELRNLHKQKVRVIPESFSADEVLREVIMDLETLIGETQAQISIPQTLPDVTADKAKMRLVFQNLIINAIKHAPDDESPKITVEYTDTEQYHQFAVKDQGKTISPKHYDRIFHIFRKLQSDAEDGEASGMGLAICKAIIQQHGGNIWIEPNIDKGNIFYFTINK